MYIIMNFVYQNDAFCFVIFIAPVYEVYRGYIVFVFLSLNMFVCVYVCVFVNFFFGKIFVTLFSGTVRPTKLKLGTHADNGGMYCVY